MEKVIVAKVNRPHGVRGELRISSLSDFIDERFVPGKTLYLEVNETIETYVLKSIRPHGKIYLIQFEGVENINEVDHLRHANILVDYDELHDLPQDMYYYIDLMGLDVYVDDEKIGSVIDVQDMPAHTTITVKTAEREIMIPYVDRFIRDVDLDAKRIDVNWMEGL